MTTKKKPDYDELATLLRAVLAEAPSSSDAALPVAPKPRAAVRAAAQKSDESDLFDKVWSYLFEDDDEDTDDERIIDA